MIQAEKLTKTFDKKVALDNLTCRIPDGCVYGLVGSNGAGKSTFLRLLCGIYKADAGKILYDGMPVYENPGVKETIMFVPDELYFLPQASMNRMAKMYRAIYKNFSMEKFKKLAEAFGLDPKANINTFSKGMKRQAATALALAVQPKYLFFDETFDGLDPVKRNLVKTLIYNDVAERNSTAIITSHSLRELEDTCDQLALLHQGGIVFESDIQDLKTSLFKVQIAFREPYSCDLFGDLPMLTYTQKGSVATFILRGDKEETEARLSAMDPLVLDILPLSLEEVFIHEMEALGYSNKDIIW
jgi:ABC-2 type transport system ATP-binding protein